MTNTTIRGRTLRTVFATVLATSALASLAVLGGVGFAKDSVSAGQYQYGKDKVTICHKGKTITVARPALKGHLKHGDTVGPCAQDVRKGKQKGKGKGKPGRQEQPTTTTASAPAQPKAPGKPEDKGKPADTPGKGKGK